MQRFSRVSGRMLFVALVCVSWCGWMPLAHANLNEFTLWASEELNNNFEEIQVRWFQPNGRVFFDTGSDDDGEVDIFQDGVVTPTVTVTELHLANYFRDKDDQKTPLSWGANFGAGIGAPAENSESNAPVVLFTASLSLELALSDLPSTADFEKAQKAQAASEGPDKTPIPTAEQETLKRYAELGVSNPRKARAAGVLSAGPTAYFEIGYAYGITADESFGDTDDSAWFIGVGVTIPY